MILIDTNVLSALRRRARPVEPAFRDWARTVPIDGMCISAVTLLESERGLLWLERRAPRQAADLRGWFETVVLGEFSSRLLPVDGPVARRCAALHVDRTRPELDMLIAATALVHDLTLATRKVRDFAGTGVRLVNPWDYRVGTGSGPA